MRSTVLTVGSQVFHLRYPFGIVEDLNQILPRGFFSVFDLDADIRTCHLLLWAGLAHEGVTYDKAGEYLIAEGAVYDPITMLGFWKKMTDALTLDGWISVSPRDSDGQENTRSLPEMIADMEQFALSEYNLSPVEFYGLTPREFELYKDHHGLRENYRAGVVCATVANCHVSKTGGGVWQPEDFIRTGRKLKPQTAGDQAAIMGSMFGGPA